MRYLCSLDRRPEVHWKCFVFREIGAGRGGSSRHTMDGWERPLPTNAGSGGLGRSAATLSARPLPVKNREEPTVRLSVQGIWSGEWPRIMGRYDAWRASFHPGRGREEGNGRYGSLVCVFCLASNRP